MTQSRTTGEANSETSGSAMSEGFSSSAQFGCVMAGKVSIEASTRWTFELLR